MTFPVDGKDSKIAVFDTDWQADSKGREQEAIELPSAYSQVWFGSRWDHNLNTRNTYTVPATEQWNS